MQIGGSMLSSAKCQDQLSTNPGTIANATPFTVPTPGIRDCSDPKVAQSDINCICMNDPNNQVCKTSNPAGVFGTGGSAVGGVGTPTGGIANNGDLPDDGQIVENGPGSKPTTGSQTSGDNGGGGLGGGGAGGGMGGFGSEGAPGPSDINKNVITGQSGGSGGGSSGGFAATSGGGGGGKGGGSGDGAGGGYGGFNLNKFLPKDAKRGLAGMSIEAKDGVTGPMGPSIWEKVSNQYQNQKNSLYQDR